MHVRLALICGFLYFLVASFLLFLIYLIIGKIMPLIIPEIMTTIPIIIGMIFSCTIVYMSGIYIGAKNHDLYEN